MSRGRNKDCRRLVRLLREVGIDVARTRDGHLKVKGPRGIAVVGSAYGSPNARQNTVATLRKVGVEIAF